MQVPTEEQRAALTRRPAGRRHVMYQEWRELLFLHWEIDPDLIRETLPPGLQVDTFEGKAYLGVVPFYMCHIRPRFLPSIAWISNFLEMNVRTYVHDGNGTPGVWFYSLDCNQPLAVRIARRSFHLPYFDAKMRANPPAVHHRSFRPTELSSPPSTDSTITYDCLRRRDPHARNGSTFSYRGTGNPKPSSQGSLDYFLAERYALFSHNRRTGQLYCGRVHHAPYGLEPAEIGFFDCTEAISQAGFEGLDCLANPCCSALYSKGVKVHVYPLKPVGLP